ncbi:MAG TPA: hypothetical protein VLI94_00275 [Solirubrobacterales bacterium]|nr:hypothetical protein [Solirubrobacterales bacterium]
MALGPTEAGRGRAIRTLVVLIAASACLGAVVASGASRSGGERTGLAGSDPVPVAPAPTPAGKPSRGEAPPRASFVEVPAAGSASAEAQFRFHVAPRTQHRQPSSSPAPAGEAQRSPRKFQCRYDGGAWRECSSPHRLDALATGPHSFAVRALARSGRPGAAASHSWVQLEPKPIAIEAAGAIEDLYPGFPAQPLPVRISNPNDVPVQVTRLTVELGADPATCPGENFKLTPAGVSPTSPLTIPAGSSAGLPAGEISAPAIRMLNLPVDQDPCQGSRLQLVFRGEAHG